MRSTGLAPSWTARTPLETDPRSPGSATAALANLELWPDYQVFVSGERVDLTRREFEVLSALGVRAGQLLPKELIHRLVWGRPPLEHRDRSVDVYVRKLRLKLAAAAPGWRYIHTHHGLGYRFEPEGSER